MNDERDLLEKIQDLVEAAKLKPAVIPKVVPDKIKKPMTIELNLSDIHYGKKTETFDLEICRRRLRDLVQVTLKEIERNKKHFNVERLIVALLGDIIESETMHGLESSRSCEMSNMEQGQAAIESLFYDVLLPLARTGLKIDVPAVTGNHDRTEKEKTHVRRGKVHITWIIYNTLKLLCEAKGLTNVTFHIPTGINVLLDIYGNPALYEHLDESKAPTKDALQKLMMKRSKQYKQIIKFLRGGHWHEFTMYGRGEIIVNDSVPGPDGYSDNLGFDSMAGQTLVFYVATKTRPNCFYRVFPVYLK
jgi:predicted phosphodiesterase